LNSEFVLGRMNYGGIPLSDLLSYVEMSWKGAIEIQLVFEKGRNWCRNIGILFTRGDRRKKIIFNSNINVNNKLNASGNDESGERSWNLNA